MTRPGGFNSGPSTMAGPGDTEGVNAQVTAP